VSRFWEVAFRDVALRWRWQNVGIKTICSTANDRLLSRAAVANEGKIHLGYMYAMIPAVRRRGS